jgi:zinc protease
MKYFLLAMFCIALFSSSSSGENRKIFPYKMHIKDLPNGLKLIAVPYDSPGIIAYYTVVRAGSRNEVEPGLSGFAHFFEHMMFRGTAKYSSDRYNDILKDLGADFNAFTTDDWTCYHTTAPTGSLETLMDLESDRFQNLKYSLEDFQKEAKAVLGEYNKSASSPFLILSETERDKAYAAHTYKHTTIGFLKDVLDMPNQYDYSLKFFDRFYRPENCIVLVVGDVKPEQFFALAEKYYGNWKHGNHKVDIPKEPSQKEERTADLSWKGATLPYMLIAYHAPAFSTVDKEKAALDLLSKLTFSPTSPLYQKLVLEQQRVDLLSGSGEDNRDPSLFEIVVRVKEEKDLNAVRDEIYAKLEELKTKPLSQSELADVKSNFRYSFAMGLNTPDNVASVLANYLNLTADPEAVNKVFALYEQVTPEDIQHVAQKYFTKENRTVITLKGAAN